MKPSLKGDSTKTSQKGEKESKFQKIRDRILKTIAEYEDMLEIAEDESQQKIVKATLKTLHKQLRLLDKGRAK